MLRRVRLTINVSQCVSPQGKPIKHINTINYNGL